MVSPPVLVGTPNLPLPTDTHHPSTPAPGTPCRLGRGLWEGVNGLSQRRIGVFWVVLDGDGVANPGLSSASRDVIRWARRSVWLASS